VIRRVCVDRYREKRRGKRVPSELTETIDELSAVIPARGFDTEEEFFASELTGIINAWLRTLDEEDRYVFVSRYYEAESAPNIAAELNISVRAVYKRLKRLKDSLAAELERNGYTI